MPIAKAHPASGYNNSYPSYFPVNSLFQPAPNAATGNFPSENSPIKLAAVLAAWNVGSLASGAEATQTVTVEGAQAGDSLTLNTSVVLAQGLVLTGYVSAANTVTLNMVNTGTSSSVSFVTDVTVEVWAANSLDKELAFRGH